MQVVLSEQERTWLVGILVCELDAADCGCDQLLAAKFLLKLGKHRKRPYRFNKRIAELAKGSVCKHVCEKRDVK